MEARFASAASAPVFDVNKANTSRGDHLFGFFDSLAHQIHYSRSQGLALVAMSTAILVHPTSLTLTPLPLPTPSTSSDSQPQHLALPTRFPSAAPHSAHAPNGNTFIWSTSSTVWEYDARGRRVGEISLPSSSEICAVAPFERGVAIASSSGDGEKGEVRIYRRGGGAGQARWALAHTIAAKSVGAMSAGDGVLVVCGEEVCAYALESGVRLDLPNVEVEMVSTTQFRRRRCQS